MAAGLGFKTFATGDILTAADTNGYLMSQTVMVFADAAARTSAITSPQEGMITYLKDTNSTEYYSGSAWVAIGATSGGGLTLLSTTTLTGASTTISSINQTYKALLVYVYGVTNATSDNSFFVHPNSVTNTAYSTGTIAGSANNSAASSGIPLYWNGNPDRTSSNNASTIWIYNYASTTNYKTHQTNSVYQKSGAVIEYNSLGGGITTNSAITELKFISSGGSLSSGTVLIYGVN